MTLMVCALWRTSNAAHAADPKPTTEGILTGQFLYDGTPPIPQPLSTKWRTMDDQLVEMPNANVIRDNKLTDDSLIVGADHGIANIVIWVRSKEIPFKSDGRLPEPTLMYAKGCLEPHVVTLAAPGGLTITNDDEAEKCDIATLANDNDSVDRLLAPKQQSKIEFKQAEVLPVRVFGHIQRWILAYVVVRPNSYFAVTDKEGRFKIENLPPGEWEFQVWQERCEPAGYLQTKNWPKGRFRMKIAPGDNDLGVIKLSPALFHESVEAMP